MVKSVAIELYINGDGWQATIDGVHRQLKFDDQWRFDEVRDEILKEFPDAVVTWSQSTTWKKGRTS